MKTVRINNSRLKNFFAIQSDKSDKPFLNNMRECRSIKLYQTDIVADIGAYIGEYSIHCINSGVEKVFSYEPTPNTFKILSKNKRGNMEIKNVAVVGDNRKTAILNISKGIGVTNSIAKAHKKSYTIEVPCIRYEDAIKDATIVKIDVEGAEYDYNIIQPQLRAIILEFHPRTDINWKSRTIEIMKQINRAGFKTIIEPTFQSGWNLTGSFQR